MPKPIAKQYIKPTVDPSLIQNIFNGPNPKPANVEWGVDSPYLVGEVGTTEPWGSMDCDAHRWNETIGVRSGKSEELTPVFVITVNTPSVEEFFQKRQRVLFGADDNVN